MALDLLLLHLEGEEENKYFHASSYKSGMTASHCVASHSAPGGVSLGCNGQGDARELFEESSTGFTLCVNHPDLTLSGFAISQNGAQRCEVI